MKNMLRRLIIGAHRGLIRLTRKIDVPKIKNKVSAISAICRCSVNNAEKKKNRANKVGFHAIY
jgi:hypothetical protein